jgi:hypothetical protein
MKNKKLRWFENVHGVTDVNDAGEEFNVNMIENVTKFPEVGDPFRVGSSIYEYLGENTSGESVFRRGNRL